MKVRALVFEHSYQDDYEDGEVSGTYQNILVDDSTFNSIEEAVKYFKSSYGHSDFKVEMIDDETLCAAQPMQMCNDNGFYATADKSREGG